MDLNETFVVDADGYLAREVVPARGAPYRHRCPLAAYEEVAHAIDEMGPKPVTLGVLRERLPDLPCTQVAVAVAFLKERGSLRATYGRKHLAATVSVYLDAMTEYHALREGAPGSTTNRKEG